MEPLWFDSKWKNTFLSKISTLAFSSSYFNPNHHQSMWFVLHGRCLSASQKKLLLWLNSALDRRLTGACQPSHLAQSRCGHARFWSRPCNAKDWNTSFCNPGPLQSLAWRGVTASPQATVPCFSQHLESEAVSASLELMADLKGLLNLLSACPKWLVIKTPAVLHKILPQDTSQNRRVKLQLSPAVKWKITWQLRLPPDSPYTW